MKKQISLLIAVMMVVLLAGCGRAAEDTDTLKETSSEKEASSAAESQPEEGDSSDGAAEESAATSSASGTAGTEAEEAEESWLVIDSTDAYDAAYAFSVPEDGSYAFAVSNAEAYAEVTWEVYVLEEAFEDGIRYLPQAYAPCLTESGTLTLTARSQVYCVCSVNGFTDDALEEGSSQLLVYQTIEDVDAGTFSQPLNGEDTAGGVAITSEDAYDDGCYAFEAVESGVYSFTIQNAEGYEDVTWEIYVLEEAFDEATRYIPQANEPSLTGEGSVEIESGSWVYCFCSVSSFTGELDEVAGASTLTYTIQ